jgi:hypothetical protein
MLSGGIIGRDRLIEAISQHTQQIVDSLLMWTTGTYEFQGDDRSIPKLTLKVPLNIEELLMEGMRRMDELATIKQTVLAPDLYLLRSSDAIDRSELSRELLVVYDLVSGSTSVEQVVARSPLGEYTSYESISALLESGLLVVDSCPPETVSGPQPVVPQKKAAVKPARPVTATWGAVMAITAGSLLFGLALGPLLRNHSEGFVPRDIAEAQFRFDAAMASRVYTRIKGEPNPTTDRLVREGYLEPAPGSSGFGPPRY